MSSHDNYFDEKKAAAVLKHALLGPYITVFGTMTSLQNQARRAWFIDAYAGAGKYESGDAGSPLIALKAARTLASFRDSPRDLRCVFIEHDPKNFAELRAIVEATETISPPILMEGSADVRLPEAVKLVGNDPLLTFLDPFGTSLSRRLMVDTLLKRPDGASEVLLNFHLGSVARIAPFALKPDQLGDGDRKTLARLDSFLGYEDWRDVFFKTYRAGVERTATLAAQDVARDYRDRIGRETGYRSFPVEVRKARGHVPIFELTLFYKPGTPAEYKFADAASYANAAWRKRTFEDEARSNAAKYSNALFSLADDFSVEQFEKRWKNEEKQLDTEFVAGIRANLVSLFPDLPLSVETNVARIYGDYLGLAGEKHLRRAWNELADLGQLARCPKKPYYASISRP